MSTERKPVNLTIMDKDYVVGCTEEEREALLTSVDRAVATGRQVLGVAGLARALAGSGTG
mgnify:CR=1 FL=1